jgi:putative membrane protein
MKMLLRVVITMCAIYVASRFVPGISTDGSVLALAGVALVFAVVNEIVKPILSVLSLPFVVVTLGLFLLVINALMLMLTSKLSGALGLGFHVQGFGAAFWGGIIISVVSTLLYVVIPEPRRQQAPRP